MKNKIKGVLTGEKLYYYISSNHKQFCNECNTVKQFTAL